jgi:biotin carboxylase
MFSTAQDPRDASPRTSDAAASAKSRPVIVFIDDAKWESFFQLAAFVRRAGYRTIRVSTEHHKKAALASHLVFDRFVQIPDAAALARLPDILADEVVADVQCSERHYPWLFDHPECLPETLRPGFLGRRVMIDKLTMARDLQAGGIPAPQTVTAEGGAPAAADQLGLPMVFKPRVGSGGTEVSIVATVEEAEQALSRATGGLAEPFDPADLLYQRYVAGEVVQYSAVARAGQILIDAVALCSRVDLDPLGPSTTVQVVDDPEIAAMGRRVVELTAADGLINVEMVRDEEGRLWPIDVNPRTWGWLSAGQIAGIDFVGAYLQSLGLAPPPAPGRARPPVVEALSVFPRSLEPAVHAGRVVPGFQAFRRAAAPYRRALGWRYWMIELALFSLDLRRGRSAARRRPRESSR